jgi:hypothetical protein
LHHDALAAPLDDCDQDVIERLKLHGCAPGRAAEKYRVVGSAIGKGGREAVDAEPGVTDKEI